MSLNKEDYSECLFNPLEVGKIILKEPRIRSLFEEYEPLIEEMDDKPTPKKTRPKYDEDGNVIPVAEVKKPPFEVGSSRLFDKVMKYIIIMYDKNTPLKAKENHLATRKAKSASIVGFRVDENRKLNDRFALAMIKGENPIVNRMIVLYVRMFRSHLYMRIVAMEEAYSSALENILGGSHEKKSTDQIKQLGDDIENMYIDLFSGKGEAKLTEEMLIVMEEERAGIKPEDYAQRIANGEYIAP